MFESSILIWAHPYIWDWSFMLYHRKLLATSAEECWCSSLQGSCLLSTTCIGMWEPSLALTWFRVSASSKMQHRADTHSVKEVTALSTKGCEVMSQVFSASEKFYLFLIRILNFQTLPLWSLHLEHTSALDRKLGSWKFCRKKTQAPGYSLFIFCRELERLLESRYQKTMTWGYQCMKSWTWASNVCLEDRNSMLSWAP